MKLTSESIKTLTTDCVLKLDIGCGHDKGEGFMSIDSRKLPGVDIVHDLSKFPWPIPDSTITLASCSQHIHKIDRTHGGFISFMNEVWRVLKYDGQFRIAVPFATSPGFLSDPCAINPCTAITWHYFDPLQASGLYKKYEPCPWKVETIFWQTDGLMEVLLSKRRDDISYHWDKKIKYA